MVHYRVVDTDDVDETDLSTIEAIPPNLNIRAIDDALGTQEIGVKLWYFEPGEEIQYHAHSEQEELYYVIEGEFSLKLGKSGEEEYVEAGPGTFWVAGPETGHGHRYVGENRGVVLALGAPRVDDPGLDPHSLDHDDE
ncbi:cupin domain-containing protein [Halorarius litoreus]|uniref:cupin domain-containing protein n=1 Tax=Halorarius litoreus TaxID=2962676 RepID=UPI0020CEC5EF|nr:cupin domain-containing protein [Halorarius litoreus]